MNSKTVSRKKIALLIALIVAVIAGCYYYWYSHRPQPLVLYGNVTTRQVALAFNASERINAINVQEGDAVKKGQVLATLDTRPLQLNIAKVKAQILQQQAVLDKAKAGNRPEEIESARAALSQAEATARNASTTNQRMQALLQADAISKQEADNAATAYNTAAAAENDARAKYQLALAGSRSEDIAAQEAALQALDEQLALYQYQLQQATLVAPQDGIIRSRLLEVGDMASPSAPVFMLSPDSRKWIRAYIPEDKLTQIHEGEAATITVDGLKEALHGQVGFISSTAEFTPKSVQTPELRTSLVYEVRIYVDDPQNVLRMGMPATVTF